MRISARVLCVSSLLAYAPGAGAYAVEPVATRPPVPDVHIDGEATVREVRVVVRCDTRWFLERTAECTVRARFEVVARGALTLAVNVGASLDEVRFDGRRASTSTTVESGARVRVEVSARRTFSTRTRWSNGPWVLPPMVSRHPFFGDTEATEYLGGDASLALCAGSAVTYEGEVALDAQGDRRVRSAAWRRSEVMAATSPSLRTESEGDDDTRARENVVGVSMALAGREGHRGAFQNGGPVLGLGARSPLQGEGLRFFLRGAYEVAVAEYFFGSVAVETDFESVFESLVVDVASPELLVVIPSFHAGVGVVARQLGTRPPDFGLRLRVGGGIPAIGGDVDFDYWPEISGWTLTTVFRLGV